MDARPISTLRKGNRKRGKGPYLGVRLRGGRWISEIRIPKTSTRIWLGSHLSPEKAARAYDAALYCLKGEAGLFNFPNNRRPDLGNRSIGSLPTDEIQGIAAEFSCLEESVQTSSPLSPPRAVHQIVESPILPNLGMNSELCANKVDREPNAPASVPEEPYIPILVSEEESCVPAFVPDMTSIANGNSQLDEWMLLEGDWIRNFL